MANVTILTTDQQTQAAANKAAADAALAAYVAALATHQSYMLSVASAGSPPDVNPNGRVQLTDDGTAVIVG
jgi:hypothetical protein